MHLDFVWYGYAWKSERLFLIFILAECSYIYTLNFDNATRSATTA